MIAQQLVKLLLVPRFHKHCSSIQQTDEDQFYKHLLYAMNNALQTEGYRKRAQVPYKTKEENLALE